MSCAIGGMSNRSFQNSCPRHQNAILGDIRIEKILFVCAENSCRSQMAEGFAKKSGQGKIEAFSVGSNPYGQVEKMAIKVMEEKGIDISDQKSKGFGDLEKKDFDYVITLGCEDVCPFVPARQRIEWDVPDPKEKSIEGFRKTRDEIERRVRKFVESL
jgi:arsenate reductase